MPISAPANGAARPAAMPPRGWPAPSSSSWSAPTPMWWGCRSTRPWRCWPARGFRPISAGPPRCERRRRCARSAVRSVETGGLGDLRKTTPCKVHSPAATSRFDLAEHVDLDGAGEQRPPALQEGLQPRVAGELLAIGFERLVHLVIDDLDELGRLIDVLQQA